MWNDQISFHYLHARFYFNIKIILLWNMNLLLIILQLLMKELNYNCLMSRLPIKIYMVVELFTILKFYTAYFLCYIFNSLKNLLVNIFQNNWNIGGIFWLFVILFYAYIRMMLNRSFNYTIQITKVITK